MVELSTTHELTDNKPVANYVVFTSMLCGIWHVCRLLDLVTITSEEAYVKLTVSSLDYTKEGICRIILSKALTATSEVLLLKHKYIFRQNELLYIFLLLSGAEPQVARVGSPDEHSQEKS